MAEMGIRRFQDLVGRTDLLKPRDDLPEKVKLLNFSAILKNALQMRPGTNIIGGSMMQVSWNMLWLSKSISFVIPENDILRFKIRSLSLIVVCLIFCYNETIRNCLLSAFCFYMP